MRKDIHLKKDLNLVLTSRPLQLAKRETQEWVEYVLERFNSHIISEQEARLLLGLKRASLYKIRKRWLKCLIRNTPFKLKSSGQHQKLSLTEDFNKFLHKELFYIKKEACFYRGKFNYSYLSEKILKRFDQSIYRNTIRYEQTTKEKKTPCIRFEMDSIGALFQHDTSHHIWLPHLGRYHDLMSYCQMLWIERILQSFNHLNYPSNVFFQKEVLSSLQLRENIPLFHSKNSLSHVGINRKETGLSESL